MAKPKEVYFDEWCRNCINKTTDENEMPCDECLEYGFNMDSHKPRNYEEAEKN